MSRCRFYSKLQLKTVGQITFIDLILYYLPMHVGTPELHDPPDRQVMVLEPDSVKPLLHSNVTVLPIW